MYFLDKLLLLYILFLYPYWRLIMSSTEISRPNEHCQFEVDKIDEWGFRVKNLSSPITVKIKINILAWEGLG